MARITAPQPLAQREIERLIRFKDLPYDPFRRNLYTVSELMKGYDPKRPGQSLDEKIAAHYQQHNRKLPDVREALAQRIHDHSIDMALYRFTTPKAGRRKIIGVMGGHSLSRKDPLFETVAELTWRLCQEGFAIVSGGGPGVMEAANLGAYLSLNGSDSIQVALQILGQSPEYDKDRAGYIQAAREVRKQFRNDSGKSLAVPTWAYSDEPTGQFSSKIGKYFSNSIREDGLLAIAADGVVFARGSAGTLQEIFQDAVHNSYWSFNTRAPMCFLGPDFFCKKPAIYDVLQARAQADGYGDMVGVFSTAQEIVAFIKEHPIQAKPHEALKRTFGLTNLEMEVQ